MDYVIIILATILATIFGYKYFVWGTYKRRMKFVEKAKENGCVAVATRVRSQSKTETFMMVSPDKDAVKVTYEYEVDGKKYYKKVIFERPMHVPWTITIYYAGHNPKKVVTSAELKFGQNSEQMGCITTILFAFLIFQIVGRALLL